MLRRLFVQFSSVFGWQNMSTRIQMKRNAADDGTLQAYFECSELEIAQFFLFHRLIHVVLRFDETQKKDKKCLEKKWA